MLNYRRALVPGASWFFTVNLLERRGNDLLVRHIDALRASVRRVHRVHPFTIDAWVVLPEHMHCVWTLPPGDAAYSLRWRLIKTFFCHTPCLLMNIGQQCACREASVASGSGVIGSISSSTKRTSAGTSITYT